MPENRLIFEKSPYLLQHAYNPVDWYPWGKEAFAKAEAEDKPVFLSIGYSTCHWCHVMERESFETEEAAQALNRDFVAVKVDREERPDIDAVYMEVCQAMTGSGGWPLTVLLTPEQKPFWAGTYLPLHNRYGQPGLVELLEAAAQLWREDRDSLTKQGEQLADLISNRGERESRQPDKAMPAAAARHLGQGFDPQNGGFGGAPKFPSPQNLLFLLRWGKLEQDHNACRMAETTLTQMARGGLFDHVGGGFSRYSTDKSWLVPHFEKMLYDNALLAYAYLEMYQQSGQEFFRAAATRTMDYALRELSLPEGGFCCGQDADSEGVEGKYYLFTPGEIEEALGKVEGEKFCRRYGITEKGNFEGKNVLNLLDDPHYEEAWAETADSLERLYQVRSRRVKPHLDDKALTSWNALMICALAKAYRVLGENRYLETAQIGLEFIKKYLAAPEGRLYIRWRDNDAAGQGQLDDYAFLIWALLEVYAADQDVSRLEEALKLADAMESLFWDEKAGGFFLTPADGEQLISRPKELYDGAVPSGNSIAAQVLCRLAKLTGEPDRQEAADRQLSYLAGNTGSYLAGYCGAMLAFCEALYPSRELLCACAETLTQEVLALAEDHRLHLLSKTPANAERLARIAPFTAAYPLPETGTVYYLCTGGACAAPVDSLEKLKSLLTEQ